MRLSAGVAGAASTQGCRVMDTTAFLLTASDHQPGLGTVSWQAPTRPASRAVPGSCPQGFEGGVLPRQHPSLPCSYPFLGGTGCRQGWQVCRCMCMPLWRVGHLAHGAKPGSWCKRCLAAFPLVQVLAPWHSNQTHGPLPPCLCCDTLGISWGFLGAAACRCPPGCDHGASSGLAVPRGCSMSWSSSIHLLQPVRPSLGLVLLLPCFHSQLPSPCPMCPAHPSSNRLAHACAVGGAVVLQVTAVSLGECCSPSVLPTCFGWLWEEGLRCTKAVNRSHETVNINYL